MAFRSLPSSIAFALAATASIAATTTVQAQGLFDFLWGGTQEWGGGRQMVSFDPKFTPGQIIVSFGDRRLYNIVRPGQAMSYPIAVPREQSRWQGTTTVSDKRVNPSWRPTPEMFRENPKLPAWVPGGHPMNPLGVRAMYLGASTYRIHGTDAPWTIGQAVSKGCIRMLNEDVLDLYPRIPVGTKVTVTWQQFGSHAIASNGEENAQPYMPPEPTGYRAPPTSRKIKNLPTMTPAGDDGETIAAVQMDGGSPLPVDESGKPVAKSTEHKTTEQIKKAEAHKKPAPTSTVHDAAAAASRAAAAAGKAAEAAREAAETAKKAAEEAKKATSAQAGQSAAL